MLQLPVRTDTDPDIRRVKADLNRIAARSRSDTVSALQRRRFHIAHPGSNLFRIGRFT